MKKICPLISNYAHSETDVGAEDRAGNGGETSRHHCMELGLGHATYERANHQGSLSLKYNKQLSFTLINTILQILWSKMKNEAEKHVQ